MTAEGFPLQFSGLTFCPECLDMAVGCRAVEGTASQGPWPPMRMALCPAVLPLFSQLSEGPAASMCHCWTRAMPPSSLLTSAFLPACTKKAPLQQIGLLLHSLLIHTEALRLCPSWAARFLISRPWYLCADLAQHWRLHNANSMTHKGK